MRFHLVFLLLLLPSTFAVTTITSCGVYNTSNEVYVFEPPLSVPPYFEPNQSPCLVFNASNIVVEFRRPVMGPENGTFMLIENRTNDTYVGYLSNVTIRGLDVGSAEYALVANNVLDGLIIERINAGDTKIIFNHTNAYNVGTRPLHLTIVNSSALVNTTLVMEGSYLSGFTLRDVLLSMNASVVYRPARDSTIPSVVELDDVRFYLVDVGINISSCNARIRAKDLRIFGANTGIVRSRDCAFQNFFENVTALHSPRALEGAFEITNSVFNNASVYILSSASGPVSNTIFENISSPAISVGLSAEVVNVTFRNVSVGISALQVGSRLVVRDSFAENVGSFLRADRPTRFDIANNTVWTTGVGMYIHGNARYPEEPSFIRENEVHSNTTCIYLDYMARGQVANNTLLCGEYGVLYTDGRAGFVDVVNNTIIGPGVGGVYIRESSGGHEVLGNTIRNFTYGIWVNVPPTAGGDYPSNIIGNMVDGADVGINYTYRGGGESWVANNTISNVRVGLWAEQLEGHDYLYVEGIKVENVSYLGMGLEGPLIYAYESLIVNNSGGFGVWARLGEDSRLESGEVYNIRWDGFDISFTEPGGLIEGIEGENVGGYVAVIHDSEDIQVVELFVKDSNGGFRMFNVTGAEIDLVDIKRVVSVARVEDSKDLRFISLFDAIGFLNGAYFYNSSGRLESIAFEGKGGAYVCLGLYEGSEIFLEGDEVFDCGAGVEVDGSTLIVSGTNTDVRYNRAGILLRNSTLRVEDELVLGNSEVAGIYATSVSGPSRLEVVEGYGELIIEEMDVGIWGAFRDSVFEDILLTTNKRAINLFNSYNVTIRGDYEVDGADPEEVVLVKYSENITIEDAVFYGERENVVIRESRNVTVRNCEMEAYGGDSPALVVEDSKDVSLLDTVVSSDSDPSLEVVSTEGALIKGLEVHGISLLRDSQGVHILSSTLHGPLIIDPTNNSVVENSTITAVGAPALTIEGFNNTVRNNTISSDVLAVNISYGSGNYVYNNHIISPEPYMEVHSDGNFLSVDPFPGLNVINGSVVAGNFYALPSGEGYSLLCWDGNGDFLCDEPLSFGLGEDLHPLASRVVQAFPPNGSVVGSNLSLSLAVDGEVESCTVEVGGDASLSVTTSTTAVPVSLPEGSYWWNASCLLRDGSGWDTNHPYTFTRVDVSLSLEAEPSWEVLQGLPARVVCRASTPAVEVVLERDGDEVARGMGEAGENVSLPVGEYLYHCLISNATFEGIEANATLTVFSPVREEGLRRMEVEAAPSCGAVEVAVAHRGRPVEGAVVILRGEDVVVATNTTGGDGRAHLYADPGVYTLKVRKRGFYTFSTEVEVPPCPSPITPEASEGEGVPARADGEAPSLVWEPIRVEVVAVAYTHPPAPPGEAVEEGEQASQREGAPSQVRGVEESRCCLFTICSLFGFVSFMGLCWYGWLLLAVVGGLAAHLLTRRSSRSYRYRRKRR